MPAGLAYSHSSHCVEVEVDIGTGFIQVLRYVVVSDCGRLINPMIVEGQIVGGVVHGIGNALFERMAYDENAQPLTTNFGEYLLPTTTTPMMASVTLTFMPLKMYGAEVGKRTRIRICHSDMRRERQSLSMLVSTARSPAAVAINIGKKQMKTEKVMRAEGPMPSQTMNSGANAILGIN